MKCIVVGSGPAGVSAAKALLAKGHEVVMIDAGKTEKRPTFPKHPKDWRFRPSKERGMPKKKLFGSKFMYQNPGFLIKNNKAKAQASSAQGGLSTVWGASMLPYEQTELDDWPVDIAPYYEKVFSFVPLAGKEDKLTRRFPLYTEPQFLAQSDQITKLLRSWKHLDCGQSRLAVYAEPDKKRQGCAYCSLCMTGCPINVIYSSQHTLVELRKNQSFEYKVGTVKEIGESKLAFVKLADGTVLRAQKLFLGAGVYSSTQLVMRAKGIDKTTILDSEYVIIPALTKYKGQKQQNSLAQAFIEHEDKQLKNVHFQIYPSSPLIKQAVQAKLGIMYYLLRPLLQPIINRMIVLQGFLHSDVSGSMQAELGAGGLIVKGNPEYAARKLKLPKLGLFLLPKQYTLPGQGFHSGGSFPMSKSPGLEESDKLGRPGFKHIHLVDSSVFPTIPATTITLSEMANAYRIAWEAT